MTNRTEWRKHPLYTVFNSVQTNNSNKSTASPSSHPCPRPTAKVRASHRLWIVPLLLRPRGQGVPCLSGPAPPCSLTRLARMETRPLHVAALGLPFRFVVLLRLLSFSFSRQALLTVCSLCLFFSEVSNRCCEGARGLSRQVEARILSRTLSLLLGLSASSGSCPPGSFSSERESEGVWAEVCLHTCAGRGRTGSA